MTKFRVLILVCVVLSAVTLMPQNGFAKTTTKPPDITTSLELQSRSMDLSLNSTIARSVAMSSRAFQSQTFGHDIRFDSIFNLYSWTVDSAGMPTATWKSVNVVFAYKETNGSTTKVVATMDPSLSRVMQVTTQHPVMQFWYTGTDVPTWSGDVFSKSFTYQSVPVEEAYAEWTVPGVQEPPNSNCFWVHCDISVWTGLTNQFDPTNGIVQGGTDSGVVCIPGSCNYSYFAWYETWPNSPTNCMSVSPGDYARSDTINEGIWTHSPPSSVYEMYVFDDKTQLFCHHYEQFPQMGTPYLGNFIVERPGCTDNHCGSDGTHDRLPYFYTGVLTENDWINIYNCSIDRYYNGVPCGSGIYDSYYMVNYGVPSNYRNIYLNGVAPSNYFSMYWETSGGT